MDEQKQKYLDQAAADFQPDKTMAKMCLPQDVELYTSMNNLYKALCEHGISFSLFFTSQDTFKTYLFYRICEPNFWDKFQSISNSQLASMYRFLCEAGFIKHLEREGFLTLTEKGQHKTFQDKMNEDLEKRKNEN
jgi:hypothetical protein